MKPPDDVPPWRARQIVPAGERARGLGDNAPLNSEGGFGPAERAASLQWFVEARVADAERALGLESPNEEVRNYLAHLLWKTLQNRKMAADCHTPREIADRINGVAAAMKRLLEAPEAAYEVEILSGGGLDIEAMQRLARVDWTPKAGRPSDTETRVVIQRLSDVECKLTGRNTKYSYDHEIEAHSGPLFLLFKAFKEAESRARGESVVPLDATLAKEIQRFAEDIRKETEHPR